MHETRDDRGVLVGVEFYEAERCYRATRDPHATPPLWRVTVDGHPHDLAFAATPQDTAADVRAQTLHRVDEFGG